VCERFKKSSLTKKAAKKPEREMGVQDDLIETLLRSMST